MERIAVPNTRIKEPFMYCPRTVLRRCSQFSAGSVRSHRISVIGRNRISPNTNAITVHALSLKRISCFRQRNQYCAILIKYVANPLEVYSQPARSNSFTASAFLAPSIERLTLSALNVPQPFSRSDRLFLIFTGYS